MIARLDHPGTVHVVACPATGVGGVPDHGRLAPALVLAHAMAGGMTPPGPVIVVGPTGAAATARRCGLEPALSIAPPLGSPRMARRALRHIAAAADRIVCWSDELSPLVARMSDHVQLVSTLPDACRDSPRRFAAVTVLTEHDAGLWRARGASNVQVVGWAEEIRHTPRARSGMSRFRQRAGVGADTLLLAALDDTPRRTDARGLAFLLSVLHTTGYPVCGVIPSVAINAPSAGRHLRAMTSRYRLLLTDDPVTDLLPEVDVAIMPEQPETGSSTVLEAFAVSCGCRVIRLSHRGRAGLKSTPGAAAPILETLDAILAERRPAPEMEPQHA